MAVSDKIPMEAESAAAAHLVGLLHSKLLDAVRNGARLSVLGAPDLVAQSMIDRLGLWLSPGAELVGPCYSSGLLQRELGVKRGAVSRAVREDRLLRLTADNGSTLYPAFQVRGRSLVRGLRQVLPVLRSGANDPWVWAQWLNAPVPGRYDGRRHIDELADGMLLKVRADAAVTAAAWSS